MERTYYLALNFGTPKGIQTYGRFELGNDKQFAESVYKQLNGRDDISGGAALYIELTEVENGVPYVQGVKHCTLDELAENTRFVSLQLFKHYGLEAAG